jgi:hypothetical protein
MGQGAQATHRKGEDDGDREERAAVEALPVEHAAVIPLPHEAGQRARASRREELEVEELVPVQRDGLELRGALLQRQRFGRREDPLDQRAAVSLDERGHRGSVGEGAPDDAPGGRAEMGQGDGRRARGARRLPTLAALEASAG